MPDNVHIGKDPDAALLAIQAAYTAQLPERLREIGGYLQHCLSEPHIDEHYQHLLMRLHKLAGSAGTFGFAELGRRATELEILLDSYLKGMSPGSDSSGAFAEVAAGIQDMLAWANHQNSSQLAGQDAL
ncbi:MAG TPA: Hpt domain-containing protein [Noviherbaspirillum sp.]|nr:Hpt domain-containing protein [Noviherbaspirillum sp.]